MAAREKPRQRSFAGHRPGAAFPSPRRIAAFGFASLNPTRAVNGSLRCNIGRERKRLAVPTPGFATVPGWLPAS